MSNLAVRIPSEELHVFEKSGKSLYKHNSNYHSLANVMEHPEFRVFFDKYFKDVDSIKTIIMFMKIYENVEKITPVKLTGYQKIAILDKIVKDRELRKELVQNTVKFYKNESLLL